MTKNNVPAISDIYNDYFYSDSFYSLSNINSITEATVRVSKDKKNLQIIAKVNYNLFSCTLTGYYNVLKMTRIVIAEATEKNIEKPTEKIIFDTDNNDYWEMRERETVYLNLHVGSDLNTDTLNNKAFFVYIYNNKQFGENCPCGMDKAYNVFFGYDDSEIKNKLLAALDNINKDKCVETPQELLDIFILLKGLEISNSVGNMYKTLKYYNMLLKKQTVAMKSNGCGCK